MISRRRTNWMILGGSILGISPFTAGAAEFWDRKDPAQWSAGDIEKLLKRSPWAEQVTVNGGGVVDAPPPGGRGGGMPGGMGGGATGGPPSGGTALRPTVRWDSALPIVFALGKKQRSASDTEFYTISVSDLPYGSRGGTMFEAAAAYLYVKDKARVRAENLTVGTGSIRFYFPRASYPLTREDREVTFEAQLGPMDVKAKFSLKDMLYRGQLEL